VRVLRAIDNESFVLFEQRWVGEEVNHPRMLLMAIKEIPGK
jgi:hypothetical protein